MPASSMRSPTSWGVDRSLLQLRLRLLLLLDQRTGREKEVLRKSIRYLERRISRPAEAPSTLKPPSGYRRRGRENGPPRR